MMGSVFIVFIEEHSENYLISLIVHHALQQTAIVSLSGISLTEYQSVSK